MSTPRDRLSLLRGVVAGLIRWTGVAWLVRSTIARRKVSILVYHDPGPAVLERHLDYLSRRYSIISLGALVNAMRSGAWADLPARAVVLTFDDGRRGNAQLLPLFRRFDVVPTIYLCSQIVATNRHYWFLEVSDSESLKGLPNADRIRELERQGVSLREEHGEPQALSRDEIERMKDQVEFGAHTRFHPILTMCPDAECESEIAGAKSELEELVGAGCRHFAYPNGDYGEREIAFLKGAGYDSGRTIDVGWNDRHTDPFRLKILGTTDSASVTRLVADLSGIPLWLSRLVEGSLRGKHRQVSRS